MAISPFLVALLLTAPAPQAPPEGEWITAYPRLEPFKMVGPPRSNDLWARMRLTVDRRGVPTDCQIIDTNLRHTETRWKACSTLLRFWQTEPVRKDGKPVAAVVERTLIVPGLETRAEALRRAEAAREEARDR